MTKVKVLLFVNTLLLAAVPTYAQNRLNLRATAPYDKNLLVPWAVKAECALETKLPAFIEEYARGQFDTINLIDDADAKGKLLSVKITGLVGTGGGAWSGAKQVTINGVLTENGKTIGTFKGMRVSGGGAFGAYKGTCSILGRCVKALGKDVAGWLKKPTMNARLGDAR